MVARLRLTHIKGAKVLVPTCNPLDGEGCSEEEKEFAKKWKDRGLTHISAEVRSMQALKKKDEADDVFTEEAKRRRAFLRILIKLKVHHLDQEEPIHERVAASVAASGSRDKEL